MATIVTGTVPADELALRHTLQELPDVQMECERIVKSGGSAIMPLLWVRNCDREQLEDALDDDTSVESVTCLSDFGDEYLYRMHWIDHVALLVQMITNEQATLLDAHSRRDDWELRVLYPNRDHLSKTHDFADEHGLSFDVDAVREMEGDPAGRYGLTDRQYRSLVLAQKRGYFEVPRGVTLEELAEEVGVSHQSLSERLRRGTGSFVRDALVPGGSASEDQ